MKLKNKKILTAFVPDVFAMFSQFLYRAGGGLAPENGILGYNLYRSGNQFIGGDGIVKKGVENTIESISRLAKDGMRDTDKAILEIMLNK